MPADDGANRELAPIGEWVWAEPIFEEETMQYQEYRDRRLREDPELAQAYQEEALKREIGRQILRLRRDRGWTQVQLAEALGTKQSAIARLESGDHRPSLATLEKVSQVLGARLEVRLTPC